MSKLEHVTANPLTWPEGWRRANQQISSKFGHYRKGKPSMARSIDFTLRELDLMGIGDWNVIISANLNLRNDGLPYSKQATPQDPGVSVWFVQDDKPRVIAIDKYTKPGCNLWAIGLTVEALRGIERWGSGEILERSFTGFAALPPPSPDVPWRSVLDYEGHDLVECREKYRRLRGIHHPDKGGDVIQWDRIQAAWKEAQTCLSG
jgi:hypothetical protein